MRASILAAAAFAFIAGSAAPSFAQDFGGAFGGFGGGSEEPIQIEADALEVRDEEKLAVYSGNVRARQGETLLQAPEMQVFYSGRVDANQEASSGISRIEAPNVVVSSVDQTATGDHMVIDMNADLITMTGNVVLTQGMNVVRGARLVVNMTTKQGRVEGGRVQTLITPSGGRPPGQ